MTFVIGNSALWPFLLLLAVPLALHLFARSRPPVYFFSSVEFIRRIVRSTLRIKRPKDWLLLLLRTLIFAAVILLFLRPVYFAQRKLAGPFQKRHVAIVVDATASMAYPDGAQTRFATACAEAAAILSGLSARDTANLVWLSANPESVFPEMGVNFGFLQEVLRQRTVTVEAGAIDKTLSLAVNLLEGQEGRREICVISDFQKSAWESVQITLPPAIDLIKIKIGAVDGANAALMDIRLDPCRPLVGEDTAISCEVCNYSPQPVRKTVFLSVGERRLSHDLMVPAWNKATAVFKHRFTAAGVVPLTARLSEDLFPADDRMASVAEVSEFVRVGMLPAEPLTAAAWQRALRALGWVKLDVLASAGQAGSPSRDALFLSGWDGGDSAPLRQALLAGRAIVCTPARDLPLSRIAALVDGAQRPDGDLFRWEQDKAGHTLSIRREQDPVFRIFSNGEFGDLSRASFGGRFMFPAAALPAGDLLLAYDDGQPALIRYPAGLGLLYLWNMPLDPEFSNWPKRSDFLPFLAELLLASRSGSGGEYEVSRLTTGEQAGLRLDRDLPSSELALRDEDGQAIPLRETRGSGHAMWLAGQSLNPGLYTWQHLDKPLAWTVVEFPSVESDLRVIPPEELQQRNLGAAIVARGLSLRDMHEGIALWPYLLALALAALLAEGLAAWWAERS